MKISWSAEAQTDLGRIHTFLARHDLDAADFAFDALIEAPEALLDFPRLGSRLTLYDPREVREFRVGNYLLRYQLSVTDLIVVRVFHAREDRF